MKMAAPLTAEIRRANGRASEGSGISSMVFYMLVSIVSSKREGWEIRLAEENLPNLETHRYCIEPK